MLHVTNSLRGGGAAIAARRIYKATQAQPDVEARIMTTSVGTSSAIGSSVDVIEPRNKHLNARTEATALRLHKSINPAHRTVSLFPSGLADHILRGQWDVVHLHWIGRGTLSVEEIGQVARTIPTVWTLHDSWAFCGAEHHPHFKNDDRFAAGYTPTSRPQPHRRLE